MQTSNAGSGWVVTEWTSFTGLRSVVGGLVRVDLASDLLCLMYFCRGGAQAHHYLRYWLLVILAFVDPSNPEKYRLPSRPRA